jgi:hypothetical protein
MTTCIARSLRAPTKLENRKTKFGQESRFAEAAAVAPRARQQTKKEDPSFPPRRLADPG